MSIVRAYAYTEESSRPQAYREAWYDEEVGEFVIHHGQVGNPGSTVVESVADSVNGEELVRSFAAQCAEDGYHELPMEKMVRIRVQLRLKGNEPTTVEDTLTAKLASELTRRLAWRGLGEVAETTFEPNAAVLHVATVHPRKAEAEVPGAAKNAGVQNSKLRTSHS